ncbi:MAG TPA: glutathione S-transferase [Ideonella sp.]|uniref:glutathione S-transferase family protein n=1 Tax=Ideonella sp. TaxID=1929293 RepID=UPI002E347857|nr:glutathione S-transferase [Ideonella sp.]HEX5682788.1 glutathione S-transferase [Ideonella sp.]
MNKPIRLYRFALSGHAHRVQLMLSLLDLPTELIDVDLIAAEQKKPEFLARNPLGQVPVIEDGDFTLADSNAILVYLALTYDERRRWLPEQATTQAEVQRWLGVAAGPLASGAAHARFATLFNRPVNPQAQPTARNLFGVVENHLEGRTWLATTDHPTIADVAMYSYTAHAPEGGISLEPYPRLRAWLQRIEALPGFVGMPRSPLPAAA